MKVYRVLVADDSFFMRKLISDIISADSRFEVADTARNGREAVEKTKRLRPDAVTLDIEMPEKNGLDALREIMDECPTPVVMLSSLTREGAKETIRALEWGAVDFALKPSGPISLDIRKIGGELLDKLAAAVKAKPISPAAAHPARPLVPGGRTRRDPAVPAAAASSAASFRHLIAIGTSTGGPRALQQVLPAFPAGLPAPVLIVQHMPPNFTKSLSQRLDSVSAIRVVEAEDGMRLTAGTAYIAPGGWHMKLAKDGAQEYSVSLSREEPRSGHRPSVDVLFESLVPYTALARHVVLMTGMGSDGARGMKALKLAGAATTIAEAEETCVVYGMPRAAVELGCVSHIVPRQRIAECLMLRMAEV
jgi:two-component system chemotaxis response regulator CheB